MEMKLPVISNDGIIEDRNKNVIRKNSTFAGKRSLPFQSMKTLRQRRMRINGYY